MQIQIVRLTHCSCYLMHNMKKRLKFINNIAPSMKSGSIFPADGISLLPSCAEGLSLGVCGTQWVLSAIFRTAFRSQIFSHQLILCSERNISVAVTPRNPFSVLVATLTCDLLCSNGILHLFPRKVRISTLKQWVYRLGLRLHVHLCRLQRPPFHLSSKAWCQMLFWCPDGITGLDLSWWHWSTVTSSRIISSTVVY